MKFAGEEIERAFTEVTGLEGFPTILVRPLHMPLNLMMS